jgi:two-component system, NarL family, invasion response regulator UvrY
MMKKGPIKIGLVDDHILFRDIIATSINSYDEFYITLMAANGKELIETLNETNIPEILVLDLNMPEMNGHTTIQWLYKNRPEIKILVLTMYDPETLIHLVKEGVGGFVKKGVSPAELRNALHCMHTNGTYCSHAITGRLFNLMKNHGFKNSAWGTVILNESEISFLQFVATELTYKEIAEKMKVSPRTVDNYRDALFIKLNVRSRVGLAMYAVKSGVVSIDY